MTTVTAPDQADPYTHRMYTLTPFADAVLALPLNTPRSVYTRAVASLADQYRIAVMLTAVEDAARSALAAHLARTAPKG